MKQQPTVDYVILQAMQLSPADRARVIERLAGSLVADNKPKRKPYGVVEADVSAQAIDQTRRAMLDEFPREDV